MSLLLLLWWASLAFAAAAFVWMGALVVARVLRETGVDRRVADARRVSGAYLDIMYGSGDAAERLRPYLRRARLLSEALLEVLGLVRGAERDRLVSSLKGLHVDQRLRERLAHGSRAGRLAAAEALAAFPSPETEAALLTLYRTSRDLRQRVAALRTLVEQGAAPPIRELLADLGRNAAGDFLLYSPMLRRLTVEAPEEALAAAERADLPIVARTVMAEALSAAGDYRAIDLLTRWASEPDIDLRAAALRGLGALGHPAAAPAILAGFQDPAWEVRAVACGAAGRIGLAQALDPLTARLTDAAWWVRFRAAEALSGLGEVGWERLRAISSGGDPIAARTASLALAERGHA